MIRTLVRAGSVRPCEGPGAPQLRRSCPHRPARTGRLRIVVLLVATVAGWGCASTVGGESEPPISRGPTTTLESEIRALADGFGGAVGVYARRLDTGDSVSLAADELFPTASMIKVSLLVGLEGAVAAGQLTRDDRVAYHDSLHYPSGGDIINKLQPGAEIPLGHLAVLMIVLSDNTASLWIQGLIGGATVNTWLEEHGFERTRINSRVEGRRGDWESYGWGQSTPREMARLLVMIRDGKAVSQAASDRMYRLLSRSYWPDGATGVLPAEVAVASKAGAVSAARSEVLLVGASAGDYVLCVMTRDQADARWTADNEGDRLIRAISAAVYERWGTVGRGTDGR